nr:unnamed protein product [Callosobruchus analis]
MEPQGQELVAGGSPAEVPNDPGKMFIGGLSWQTSPVILLPSWCVFYDFRTMLCSQKLSSFMVFELYEITTSISKSLGQLPEVTTLCKKAEE